MNTQAEQKLFTTLGGLLQALEDFRVELKQAREDRGKLFTATGENAKAIGILIALKSESKDTFGRIISICSIVAVVILGLVQLNCGG